MKTRLEKKRLYKKATRLLHKSARLLDSAYTKHLKEATKKAA